jgi:hypothetical protein
MSEQNDTMSQAKAIAEIRRAVWNEAISAACDVIRKATREFKRRTVREALEEVYNDVRGLKR